MQAEAALEPAMLVFLLRSCGAYAIMHALCQDRMVSENCSRARCTGISMFRDAGVEGATDSLGYTSDRGVI